MNVRPNASPGDPRQVIPVLESHKRDERTLTLIALERRDHALFATVELEDRSWDGNPFHAVTAEFSLDVHDDQGVFYRAFSTGGGAGGGPEGMTSHTRVQIVPVPPAQSFLTVAVHTHFTESITPEPPDQQGWIGNAPTVAREWSDPTPWVFELRLPAYEDQLRDLTDSPPQPPAIRRQPEILFPRDPGQRRRITPVMQASTVGDATFTLLAIEFREAGFQLVCRVLRRRPPRGPYDGPVRCSVVDDRGNGYTIWPGHGSGHAVEHGFDWWLALTGLPALDPAATRLYVAMESPGERVSRPHDIGGMLDQMQTEQWLFEIWLV